MTTHAEAAELLGAYALDAVEPDEAEAIEAHLETCPRCRSELQGQREVVGLLAYAGQDAPEGLWDRVAARLHQPEGGSNPPPLALMTASGSGTGTGRRRRASWPVRRLSLLAAAAVVVVALLGVEVDRLQNRTDHLSRQIASMSGQVTMAQVRAALAAPGAREVRLRSPQGGSIELDAVILPGGEGYLYDSGLTPLSADRTYQLWGVVGTQVISYGVLGSTLPGVETFRASAGVSALAVTDEVAGGVVSSTQPPVAVGAVA